MNYRTKTHGSLARHVPWLGLALATSVNLACVIPGTVEQAGEDVSSLADDIVESARQRVELGQMRVVVREIQELRRSTIQRSAAQPGREDLISKTLEHEFVIALSRRMNVVESEIVSPMTSTVPATTLSDLASTYGATHLLVGDYQRDEYGLVVSVRLIDADTHVIVAAARGRVAFPELDDNRGRFAQRGDVAPQVAESAPSGVAPLTVVASTGEPAPDLLTPAPSGGVPGSSGGKLLAAPAADETRAAPAPVPAFVGTKRPPATDKSRPAPAKPDGTAAGASRDAPVSLQSGTDSPPHGPGWHWLRVSVRMRSNPPEPPPKPGTPSSK